METQTQNSEHLTGSTCHIYAYTLHMYNYSYTPTITTIFQCFTVMNPTYTPAHIDTLSGHWSLDIPVKYNAIQANSSAIHSTFPHLLHSVFTSTVREVLMQL